MTEEAPGAALLRLCEALRPTVLVARPCNSSCPQQQLLLLTDKNPTSTQTSAAIRAWNPSRRLRVWFH